MGNGRVEGRRRRRPRLRWEDCVKIDLGVETHGVYNNEVVSVMEGKENQNGGSGLMPVSSRN